MKRKYQKSGYIDLSSRKKVEIIEKNETEETILTFDSEMKEFERRLENRYHGQLVFNQKIIDKNFNFDIVKNLSYEKLLSELTESNFLLELMVKEQDDKTMKKSI